MTGFGDLKLKFLLILAISVIMSSLNFFEKSFITSRPNNFGNLTHKAPKKADDKIMSAKFQKIFNKNC